MYQGWLKPALEAGDNTAAQAVIEAASNDPMIGSFMKRIFPNGMKVTGKNEITTTMAVTPQLKAKWANDAPDQAEEIAALKDGQEYDVTLKGGKYNGAKEIKTAAPKADTEITLIKKSHEVDAQGRPTQEALEAKRTLVDIEQTKVRIARESRNPQTAKDRLQVTTDKDGNIVVVDLTTGKGEKVTYGATGEPVKALPKGAGKQRTFPWDQNLKVGDTYQGKKVVNIGRDKTGKPVQVLLEGETQPRAYTAQVQ
jgi:hypothetical protein